MSEMNIEVWVPLRARRAKDIPEHLRPGGCGPDDLVCMPDVPAGTAFTTRRAMPVDRDPDSPTFRKAACAHVPILVSQETADHLPARVVEQEVPRADRLMVEVHRALKYGGATTDERRSAVDAIFDREKRLADTAEGKALLSRLLVHARMQPRGLRAEHAVRIARDLGLADGE